MNGTNISLGEQRAILAEKALDSALETTAQKAGEYKELAQKQHLKYSIAKTLAVVLSVSTPTFVAFQTQHLSANHALAFSIIAICLTTGTGIVTGLQAAFKWGEGFARSTVAALQLDELLNSIRLESLIYRTTPDSGLKYSEMKRLCEKTGQQTQRIIQTLSQSEFADITQPTKRPEEALGLANPSTATKTP
jgi:hypothetical protein